MANPRKFSEKIALHNQKQAEETAAFEAIMREVGATTRPKKNEPQQQLLTQQGSGLMIQPQVQSNFHHGSLPNVNNSIDLQGALDNLEDIKQGSVRRSLIDKFRQRSNQANKRSGGGSSGDRRADTSPYGISYLSPPDSSWRRTSSDSAIHASATGQGLHGSSQPGHCRVDGSSVNTLSIYQPLPGGGGGGVGRPKSCNNVPGINVYPSPEQGQSIPISNNTGSLPDLSSLHFPAPLPTPLDGSEGDRVGAQTGNNYFNSSLPPVYAGGSFQPASLPSNAGPVRVSPHTSPTRHRGAQRGSPTPPMLQGQMNGAVQLSHSLPSQESLDPGGPTSHQPFHHPYQSPRRGQASPRRSPKRRGKSASPRRSQGQVTLSDEASDAGRVPLPSISNMLLNSLVSDGQLPMTTSNNRVHSSTQAMDVTLTNGCSSPGGELTEELTQFLLSSMNRPGTTILHTRNPSAPTIVISPDCSSAPPTDVFNQPSSQILSTSCTATLLDGLCLNAVAPSDSTATSLQEPSYSDNSTACSSNAQNQSQGTSYIYRTNQSDCPSPSSPHSPNNQTPSGSPSPQGAGGGGGGGGVSVGEPQRPGQPMYPDDYLLFQQQIMQQQFNQFSMFADGSQGSIANNTKGAGVVAGMIPGLMSISQMQPLMDSTTTGVPYNISPSLISGMVTPGGSVDPQRFFSGAGGGGGAGGSSGGSSQPPSPYHSPHQSPHGSHSSQSSVASPPSAGSQASAVYGQQQQQQQQQQQPQMMIKEEPDYMSSDNQQGCIPDIIFTDIEALAAATMSKDLASGLPGGGQIGSQFGGGGLTDSFDTSDLFSSEEVLRSQLSPLDYEALQMLTDSSLVTDPATEDSFRLDRL